MLEFLVVASFHILGSGCTFNLAEEFANVLSCTIRNFYEKKFCKWGRVLSRKIIRLPETVDKNCHVVRLYGQISLPGCVGSVDCTHLTWDTCPVGYLSQCKGKKKYTTLDFQAVVSHTKKNCLSVFC